MTDVHTSISSGRIEHRPVWFVCVIRLCDPLLYDSLSRSTSPEEGILYTILDLLCLYIIFYTFYLSRPFSTLENL